MTDEPPRDPGHMRYGGGDLMLIMLVAIVLSLIAAVVIINHT